jgi:hypothetical protein
MNTKKSQFLSAVRIIAQNDSFILNLAEGVAEDTLPDYPGGAALRFVTAVSRLCEQQPSSSTPSSARKVPVACRGRFAPSIAVPIQHRCHAK